MIFRERTSAVCVYQGQLLTVRLEDPTTGSQELYLPGGALEAGESPEEAAVRETIEETGYVIQVDPTSHRASRYPFTWDGRDYDCLTHYFTGKLTEPKKAPALIDDASYHRGVEWIPLSDIERVFAYDKGICDQVLALSSDSAPG